MGLFLRLCSYMWVLCVSLGRAHHFLYSATDTMKGPSALAHWFVQGKMERHWFAHPFAPSPVYTLSLHCSIPHSPALDVKVPQWHAADATCNNLSEVTSLYSELCTSTDTNNTGVSKRARKPALDLDRILIDLIQTALCVHLLKLPLCI